MFCETFTISLLHKEKVTVRPYSASSVGPGAYLWCWAISPWVALPYIGGRLRDLSAELKVTFAVRLLLISLPPSREHKGESTLLG